MEKLSIKYATYMNAQAPRPIRLEIGGWSGPLIVALAIVTGLVLFVTGLALFFNIVGRGRE